MVPISDLEGTDLWARWYHQGLRIAPPEAPVTGYMFGKGVYFADMVSKSANYWYVGPPLDAHSFRCVALRLRSGALDPPRLQRCAGVQFCVGVESRGAAAAVGGGARRPPRAQRRQLLPPQ
eukprot:3860090-Rhodomonas_salina.1